MELEPGTPVGDAIALEAYEDGSAEWLRQRREGLGGSDAGVVLGYQPYGNTREELWKRKRDRKEFQMATTPMKYGSRIEPHIQKELKRRGDASSKYREFQDLFLPENQFKHKDYEWWRANVDGMLLGPDRAPHLLVEIKSSINSFKGVPDTHYAQIQHYLGVLGLRGCKYVYFHVPFDRECALEMERKFVDDEEGDDYWKWVLEKGNLTIEDVGRDQGFIDKLRGVEQDFWKCVEHDENPGERKAEGEVDLQDRDLTRRMQELAKLQRKAERIEDRIEQKVEDAYNEAGKEQGIEERIAAVEEQLQRELDAVSGSPKKIHFPDGSVASYHNGWGKWDLRPAEPDDSLDSLETISPEQKEGT